MKNNMHPNHSNPRKRILEASLKLFAELGYGRTSIDLICKEARVNRAMISYYYGGKLKLFKGIIENSTSEFLRQLREKVYNKEGTTPRLRTFIKTYIRRNVQDVQIAEIVMREVGTNFANSGDILTQHFLQVIAILTDVIQEGAETNIFDKTIPPIVMASYVFCSLNSFLALNRMIHQIGIGPKIDADQTDLIAEQLYKLTFKGISAK